MTKYYQILSFFFSNEIRIFLCLCIVPILLKFSNDYRKCAVFSACAAIPITIIACFYERQLVILGVEIIIILVITRYLFKKEIRTSLFLIWLYESFVALWDFIVSAGLGIVFQSVNYLDRTTLEHFGAIWIVRLLMAAFTIIAVKRNANGKTLLYRIISFAAILGMMGIILLSEQSVISVSDDEITTWAIISMINLSAIMVYRIRNRYEMEKAIAQLESEKAKLIERDYQTLSDTYTSNAKLYHDFHNHLETLHQYLIDGNSEEALHYIDDLRSPLQTITQTVWTGDKAIDYLINSKIAIAETDHIQVNANIEFPRHTNIRSADLVAILGNLIDNALEAAVNAEDNLRFINLTIRRINDMLIVKVENGCKNAPKQIGETLQTTKDNLSFHGWGLKSVQSAAERYDGTVVTEYENHIFKVVVTLSYEAVKN